MIIQELNKLYEARAPDSNIKNIEFGCHPATDKILILKIIYKDKTVASIIQKRPNNDIEFCIHTIRVDNEYNNKTGCYDWGTVVAKPPKVVEDNKKLAKKCMDIMNIYIQNANKFYKKSKPALVKL